MAKDAYSKVHELSKRTALLASINNLVEWDQETYMPEDAISFRALQNELLASLVHKQSVAPAFAKALGKLIDLSTGEIVDKNLTHAQQVAARWWRRQYLQKVKLPAAFVKSFAKTSSLALHAWAKAKAEKNFREFAPHLEKIVALSRKKADLLGFVEHPYDALLDLYEPEMTTAALIPLFERLKVGLSSLLKSIATRPIPPHDYLVGQFDAEKQMQFDHLILKAMGFDPKTSRLDLSNHPFCTSLTPLDTRMTTHIHPTLLMSNIFSVVHEGGHGLYNLGLKPENYGSPLGDSISLGIDESQSRWWETIVARGLAFWQHFYPLLQKQFPEKLAQVRLEDFHRAINIVQPSFIRIESDEVTYSLHIIVRFEIEKALMEGSLKVKELPQAWNAKMHEYLGITPANDAEGCLQDIHWAMGGFGYFPTYTLGNLYASQFFSAFAKHHPDWQARVANGELGFMKEWLHKNIHQYGKEFSAKETAVRLTGEPLSEKYFLSYLQNKYKPLYQL